MLFSSGSEIHQIARSHPASNRLSWAVAACHPTAALTQGALKCRGPPTRRKLELGFTGTKGGAAAVQLFVLPAQQQGKSQVSDKSGFVAFIGGLSC